MPSGELEYLLQGETDRVEWKSSPRKTDQILQAVCALANDLGASSQPGYLVIGVHPTTGEIVDLPADEDSVQQDIVNRIESTRLVPTPSYSIQIQREGGKPVVIMTVAPYPVPPVVTVNGVAWVRRGTSTVKAREADLINLRERRPDHHLPFDTRVLAAASRGDLRLAALRAEWEAEREADEDPDTFPGLDAWLTQRQLGVPVQGDWKPNAAGVLVFGDSPQDLLPGAFVELVRYAGDDVDAEVVERKTITGNLPDQLETLWTQLKAHNAEIPSKAAGMREAFAPAYPDEALKELARNLIQHRLYEGTNAPSRVEWYDRRIELSNPGGPYGRAAEGQFGEHSDYRNPLVTGKLAELGYVQRLGRGVRRVRLLLERNGNPPLEVEIDGYTRVIVRRQ